MSFLCPCSTNNRPEKRYSVGGGNKLTAKEISKRIDRQIKTEKLQRRFERKLLLLGTAASGKSTFLRSIRILHKDNFDESELLEFKRVIYTNIMKGVMKLLYVKKELKLKWDDTKPCINSVKALLAIQQKYPNWNNYRVTEDMFLECAPHVKKLWSDKGLTDSFEQRHLVGGNEEFRDIGENLDFYLNRLAAIAVANYRPTDEHILHSRRFTDSVFEKLLMFQGTPLRIIDIGGHSNERRKWIKMFQGELQSVIYIIASSSFNETYRKEEDDNDETINKLDESFVCLRLLSENKALFTSSMTVLIFFNKDDMLIHKIGTLHIDYSLYDNTFDTTKYNPLNLAHVREHLIRRLHASVPSIHTRKYVHFTTSIDLYNVKRIFEDIRHSVMLSNVNEILPT